MGKPLRVLMVEDSEDHTILLQHELQRGGYDLTYARVETAKDMKAALDNQAWDLIISDYHMPRFRGLDALKLAQERIPDVPFLLVSGQIGEDKAVAAMKAGAHDYLPKDNLKRLIPAVERELREAENRRARKEAEEALRLSEHQFATLAQASPVGLFRTDAEGHCCYVNERWCALTGMTLEEALGEGWKQAIHPDDRERVFTQWYEAARQHLPFQSEYRFQRPDGGTTWVFGQSVAQTSPSGEVTGHIGTITDITTNKQAEEALQKYADEFQDLYSYAPCGYHSLNKEGTIIRVNETELEMLGYDRNELLGKKFSDLLTAEGLKTFQENFPQFQQQGWVRDLQFQLIRKDGTLLPVSLNSTAVKDAQGNYLMSRSTILDITERKRAEVEQTKLLDIVDASLNEIYIFDADTLHFQHVNAGALNNLGYTSEKMRTMTPIDIKPEFDEESFRKLVAPLLQGEQQKLVLQTVHQRADGSRYPVEAHLQLIERNQERLFLAVILDISERLQAEEALRGSEERWKLALQGSNDGIWDWKIKTGEVFFSKRWKEMLGFEDHEIANHLDEWSKRVHPDDLAWVTQAIQDHFAKKTPFYTTEHRVLCKDGTYKWILDRGQALWDEEGNPVRMVGSHTDISEHKQTEEFLHESKERLSLALDVARMVTWDFDILTNQLVASGRVDLVFGLPAGAAAPSYEDFLNFVHPEDRGLVFQALTQAVQEGKEYKLEYRVIWPDHTLHWLAAEGQAYRDATGRPIRVVGVAIDITERKQSEVDLRATTSRLTTLIANMQAGILVEDESRRIVLVNQAFCQIFGIQASPEALIGADCAQAAEETKGLFAEPERFVQRIQQILEERHTIAAEEILLANGQIFERDYVPIFVGEDYRGHLWQYRDITERKRAEEVLRQQSKRSQLFSEITLNIRQSLKLEEILQTTVTEVQQLLKADRVLIFQLQSDGSGNVVQEAVVPGWPVTLGQDIVDPCFNADFKDRYRHGRVGSITDIEQGNVERCYVEFLQQFGVKANLVVPILIKEDVWGLLIAHQCSAPRQWATFEIELMQQLGDQMGIALTQAQLLEQETKQRQELVRSNSDLQQFAYVASHDLQEPLRMVASYLQLLERRYKDRLDADANEFIQYAVDGAGRMQTLINDLLAYSRVGTQGKPFKLTDYADILKRALLQLKISIEETGAVITHDAPLPHIMADESQLTQVLQNLVSNAIKFQGEQVPHIHVGAKHIEGEWVFSVKDQGIGMDPQYKDRIFLIFQRLHNRTEYKGTGIGLAICKRIIERHGGRIWVESELDQGSTFYFTIPDRGVDNNPQ
jgi:PAS domain S-box-containing protein